MSNKTELKQKTVPGNACSFDAATADVADDGTFSLTPFSGQVFKHWYWGKMTFDMEGIQMRKKVIPAFKDHDSAQLVGEINSMCSGDKVILSGRFADTDAAKTIQSVKELEWECSLAFDGQSAVIEEVGEGAEVNVNGTKFMGPGTVIRNAPLYECSFTHFGAVPGTETSFSEVGPEQVVSVRSINSSFKEDFMSDDLIKQAQEDASRETLSRFSKMSEMSDDKAFVAEAFEQGLSIEEFQTSLIAKQADQIAELKAKVEDLLANAEAQVDGEEFSAEADPTPAEDLDFVQTAHKFAKDEGLSIGEAYSRVARANPELYSKHIENAPGGKK